LIRLAAAVTRLLHWLFSELARARGCFVNIQLESIGHVENDVDERKDTGWGEDISKLVLDPQYEAGLTGLAEFSHVLVIYYLHQARFETKKHLVRRPQGREDMPYVGILAQRAKNRPNPIGVTAVELVEVTGNVVTVKGLDAINGTPLIDIKPYFPVYDCKEAKVPEWVGRLMQEYF